MIYQCGTALRHRSISTLPLLSRLQRPNIELIAAGLVAGWVRVCVRDPIMHNRNCLQHTRM